MKALRKDDLTSMGISFLTLRTKFVLFISLIIISTCSGLSWYFVDRTADSMKGSLIKIGQILAKNLAHNSWYAIFTEDEVLLQQYIDGVMEATDVVYVVMMGPEGELLAARSKGTLIETSNWTRSVTEELYPDPSFAKGSFDSD